MRKTGGIQVDCPRLPPSLPPQSTVQSRIVASNERYELGGPIQQFMFIHNLQHTLSAPGLIMPESSTFTLFLVRGGLRDQEDKTKWTLQQITFNLRIV